ncbi:MAG: hypothetical protein IPJ19_17035 [Planctomycetes bacterium]|nr:hypothetical protein [Planctomycetota bacterium]
MPNCIPFRLPVLLALTCCLAACSAPHLDVIPRIQRAKFDGSVAANISSVTLASNDVDKDLGLGDPSSEFGARADLSFGAGKWTFAYAPASFSGDGTLTADITQGGVTITAGTDVKTDLKMDVATAIWTHDFFPGENVELGLGLGAHLLDFHSTITSTTDSATLDQTIPVPVIAGRAGLVFGPFDVSALLSGLKVKYGGDEATFVDADLMARYRFFGGVGGRLSGAAVLGWRKTDVKLDYTDGGDHTDADVNVSGIYYGLSIGF